MNLCFQKRKMYLFIMYTTHFRTFQSLKIYMFQDKPIITLLPHTVKNKEINVKAIISATWKGSLEIPTDLNVLQIWLYSTLYKNCQLYL
jgi:hypothetical protein